MNGVDEDFGFDGGLPGTQNGTLPGPGPVLQVNHIFMVHRFLQLTEIKLMRRSAIPQ